MLVIKNFIIDEAKVLAKIQVSKAKPKKQNREKYIIYYPTRPRGPPLKDSAGIRVIATTAWK